MVFRQFIHLFIAVVLTIHAAIAVATEDYSKYGPVVEKIEQGSHKLRVVILWGSVGLGHWASAKAIKDKIQEIYPEAEVMMKDILDFKTPFARKLITEPYAKSIEISGELYHAGFEFYMGYGGRLNSLGDSFFAEKFEPQKIYEYLQAHRPTHVISTYYFASEAIARLKDQGKLLNIPVSQVITDYIDLKYIAVAAKSFEMTFVPTKIIKDKVVSFGVDESTVLPSGIPVNPMAKTAMSDEEKKAFLIEKGIDPNRPLVVLAGGSNGVGDYIKLSKSILAQDDSIQIVASTGQNKAKYNQLAKFRDENGLQKNIFVYGLIPQPEYFKFLKSASVMVGKTGGLSSTEVVTMNVPVVFLDINGGQERYNSNYFKDNGMALSTRNQNKVGELVSQIINDDELRQSIIEKQKTFTSSFDEMAPIDWVFSTANKRLDQLNTLPQLFPNNGSELEKTKVHLINYKGQFDQVETRLYKQEISSSRPNVDIIVGNVSDVKKKIINRIAHISEVVSQGGQVRLLLSRDDTILDKEILRYLELVGVHVRYFDKKRSTLPNMTIFGQRKTLLFNSMEHPSVVRSLLGDSKINAEDSFLLMAKGEQVRIDASEFFQGLWSSSKDLFQEYNFSGISESSYKKLSDEISEVRQKFLKTNHTPVEKMFNSKGTMAKFVFNKSSTPQGHKQLTLWERELIQKIDEADTSIKIMIGRVDFSFELREALEKALDRGLSVQILSNNPYFIQKEYKRSRVHNTFSILAIKGAELFFNKNVEINTHGVFLVDSKKVYYGNFSFSARDKKPLALHGLYFESENVAERFDSKFSSLLKLNDRGHIIGTIGKLKHCTLSLFGLL